MPLIKCPECNKEISSEALNCPNCGKKIKDNEKFCINCGFKLQGMKDICKYIDYLYNHKIISESKYEKIVSGKISMPNKEDILFMLEVDKTKYLKDICQYVKFYFGLTGILVSAYLIYVFFQVF